MKTAVTVQGKTALAQKRLVYTSPEREEGGPPNFTGRYRRFLLPALLVAAGLLTYWPVFSHRFQTFWDDQWVAVNGYTDGGLTWDNLWAILTEFYHGQYAPVNQLSYTLLHAAFGYDPFWFHTLSMAGHTVNALLIFYLLKKLLGQTGRFKTASVLRISFCTALLFSVHPFLVEAVAWVAASKIVLYTLFYLLALHAYLRYTPGHKTRYYLLTLFCFVLSFGAKEQAVTLPVCLLLLDYALGRDLRARRVWLEKLPFFALSLFFGYVTMLSQAATGEGVLSKEELYPFHQNLVFASYTLFEYLVKCLVPVKLSYLYPFPNQVEEAVPLRFWLYPPMVAFLVVSLWGFWKRRWVFFGAAFFLIHIGLVLHILPLSRFAIVADRYVYVASVGVFFVLAYFLDRALERKARYHKWLAGLSVLYVLALGSYANFRSRAWHNTETLKRELKEIIEQRADYQELKKRMR